MVCNCLACSSCFLYVLHVLCVFSLCCLYCLWLSYLDHVFFMYAYVVHVSASCFEFIQILVFGSYRKCSFFVIGLIKYLFMKCVSLFGKIVIIFLVIFFHIIFVFSVSCVFYMFAPCLAICFVVYVSVSCML